MDLHIWFEKIKANKKIIIIGSIIAFLTFAKTATENIVWLRDSVVSGWTYLTQPSDAEMGRKILSSLSCRTSVDEFNQLVKSIRYKKRKIGSTTETQAATSEFIVIAISDQNNDLAAYRIISLDTRFRPVIQKDILDFQLGSGSFEKAVSSIEISDHVVSNAKWFNYAEVAIRQSKQSREKQIFLFNFMIGARYEGNALYGENLWKLPEKLNENELVNFRSTYWPNAYEVDCVGMYKFPEFDEFEYYSDLRN